MVPLGPNQDSRTTLPDDGDQARFSADLELF